MQNIPKSMWEAAAMQRHPELVELHERIIPFSNEVSFSRNLFTAKTESKDSIPAQLILQLIMEHLDKEGLKKIVEAVEEEAGITCTNHPNYCPQY